MDKYIRVKNCNCISDAMREKNSETLQRLGKMGVSFSIKIYGKHFCINMR